jgi:acyl-CoA synthetase (AMP-forming)/AMP-acid ligase II
MDDGQGTPLAAAFAALAAAGPDRPALTDDSATVTRAELEAGSNRLARAYAQLGVGAGDYVTLGLPNGIPFMEAALAVWKLGAVPQPVSPRLPALELAAILDIVAPALVVGFEAARPFRWVSGPIPRSPAGRSRPSSDLRSRRRHRAAAPAVPRSSSRRRHRCSTRLWRPGCSCGYRPTEWR